MGTQAILATTGDGKSAITVKDLRDLLDHIDNMEDIPDGAVMHYVQKGVNPIPQPLYTLVTMSADSTNLWPLIGGGPVTRESDYR